MQHVNVFERVIEWDFLVGGYMRVYRWRLHRVEEFFGDGCIGFIAIQDVAEACRREGFSASGIQGCEEALGHMGDRNSKIEEDSHMAWIFRNSGNGRKSPRHGYFDRPNS